MPIFLSFFILRSPLFFKLFILSRRDPEFLLKIGKFKIGVSLWFLSSSLLLLLLLESCLEALENYDKLEVLLLFNWWSYSVYLGLSLLSMLSETSFSESNKELGFLWTSVPFLISSCLGASFGECKVGFLI